MKLYGGIDLHSNNSVLALLGEDERLVYRKRLGNDAPSILEALAPYREAIVGLLVESTYNWYWLVDALMEAGYPVHLANTAALVQYSGLKYSDDDSDVRCLAKLLLATPLHALTRRRTFGLCSHSGALLLRNGRPARAGPCLAKCGRMANPAAPFF
jgi:transposase